MARPRSMTEESTLERALSVFWTKGYDRTSIADLSAAIGVGPSSLYNAYGSKQSLFEQAIGFYMSTSVACVGELLKAGPEMPADQFVLDLLERLSKVYTDPKTPSGCAMMEAGGLAIPVTPKAERPEEKHPEDDGGALITAEIRRGLETSFKSVFKARQRAGDELSASPKVLAGFVVGTIRGLSQHARDGATRSDLLAIARFAAACIVV